MTSIIGTTLNQRFRVEELLFLSPNGEVYKAQDLSTGGPVALKVLRPRFLVGENFGARLRQEFRLLQSMEHPNIIRVVDSGQTPKHLHFFAMEYFPGITIAKLIDQGGPLPVDRTARIVNQVASALDLAHKKGIIHRDICPANIMVSTDPNRPDDIKLLDFGLAKLLDTEAMKTSVAATGAAVMMGDPHCMSPEQAAGRALDARSDVYSLACTAYIMLTGRAPFESANKYDVMVAHTKETIPPMTVKNPRVRVPEVVERVVQHSLQRDPDQRAQSITSFASMLQLAVDAPDQVVLTRKMQDKQWTSISLRQAIAEVKRDKEYRSYMGVYIAITFMFVVAVIIFFAS